MRDLNMSLWPWRLSEISSKLHQVKYVSCQSFKLKFPYQSSRVVFWKGFNIIILHVFLGVEEKCIGQFKLIFSLLRMSEETKLQRLALEVCKSCSTQ